ncbi:hypothetical protein SHIRM173S_04707 [Streptomyces hirsutus]
MDEGEAELRQRGDGVGAHDTVAVAGGVQGQAGEAVDGLVAGDQRAAVVGGEGETARAAVEVLDADEDIGGQRLPPGPRGLPGFRPAGSWNVPRS